MNLRGVGVSPGIGHGPAYVLTASVPEPPEGATYTGEAEQEKERVMVALTQVAGELEARGNRAGGEAEEILKAQALMAEDPGLVVKVRTLIDRGLAAPRAVFEAFTKYRNVLAGSGGYLGERAADLDDIRDRVIALLYGRAMQGLPISPAEPYVLVARDLAPADTALLSKRDVAAFVTEEGGPTSHTAIIARAMGVPAVVACSGATAIRPGVRVMADGTSGVVRVEPAESDVAEAVGADTARQAAFAAAKGPGRTADGHRVPLLANIGKPADLDDALEAGAEGIGLYRTEFLFLDRTEPPSSEEQRCAYRAALEAFPEGKVVVRTLDGGADKPLAFLPAPAEPNPALGERGLRRFRRFPDVMEAQLGALAAVASPGLRVMAPMVATAEEAGWFGQECRARGLSDVGVMIEIPSAALRAREVLARVDFVSIGTNDLAQYAFAADRQVGAVSALHDPWAPALLDLVAMAASAATRVRKPCGVCGESAADPALACVLVGLGASTLSMGAAALPAVRAVLAEHTLDQCRRAAEAARAQPTASYARAAARAHLPGLDRLGL
ncbi:phosphoenolpyruvate--protein phosphotransferase [Nonomuraea phyllanthi]|uniref:Phosphoenolpyruvate-protein phosphotransferase n=1 Tax=Nonomuraea phyllanthi TaxID=2219224 RepID=A0A5C4WVF1_9ACTN|nr:phosphoenolpyruvate--protein phosphotransferase [Nonomuraea phyllanthi]KAB8197578.1 phosphoenolpyruvate--protein phosphotransferase [Nonomuraea phyllanthi]QFY06427.1 phosphoenolpyruvate--protein phosphotransferase [Nonomuraea phyllanthi]